MEQNDTTIALNYNWLVLDTIRKARDAKAAGNKETYAIYSEYALQLLIPYISRELRFVCEADYKLLVDAIASIKSHSENEQSRKMQIIELRADFADAHRSFTMAALAKVGIVKVTEEGVIDFSILDLDQMKAIVHSSGITAGAQKVLAKDATTTRLASQ